MAKQKEYRIPEDLGSAEEYMKNLEAESNKKFEEKLENDPEYQKLKKAAEEAEKDMEKRREQAIQEERSLLDKLWAGRRVKDAGKAAAWTGRRAVDVGVVGTSVGFAGFKLFRKIVSPIGWIWKLSKWLMIQWKNFGKEGSPEQIDEYWEKVHGGIEKLADRSTEIPKEEEKKK